MATETTPVTVIIPVRNRAAWLGRALASVLGQTLQPAEIVVVDDGSTDDLDRVLAEYPRVRLIRQDAAGAYAARNRGIALSTQPFIAFLDSDDVWHARKLELQMPLFERASIGAVFGDARIVSIDDGGRSEITGATAFERNPPLSCTTGDLIHGNCVPFSSLVVRRTAFDGDGEFDPRSRLSSDWRWLLRFSFRSQLACVREPVIDYTVHGDNWSGNLPRSLASRLELFQEELDADPQHGDVLRHVLFVLRLRIAIARLRRRWDGSAVPAARPSERAGVLNAVRWSLSFIGRETALRTRIALRRTLRASP